MKIARQKEEFEREKKILKCAYETETGISLLENTRIGKLAGKAEKFYP
jgi:hypothetical protein